MSNGSGIHASPIFRDDQFDLLITNPPSHNPNYVARTQGPRSLAELSPDSGGGTERHRESLQGPSRIVCGETNDAPIATNVPPSISTSWDSSFHHRSSALVSPVAEMDFCDKNTEEYASIPIATAVRIEDVRSDCSPSPVHFNHYRDDTAVLFGADWVGDDRPSVVSPSTLGHKRMEDNSGGAQPQINHMKHLRSNHIPSLPHFYVDHYHSSTNFHRNVNAAQNNPQNPTGTEYHYQPDREEENPFAVGFFENPFREDYPHSRLATTTTDHSKTLRGRHKSTAGGWMKRLSCLRKTYE